MDGRTFLPLLVFGLVGTSATANSPVRLSPVLPEVTKHLAQGFQDAENNTPSMARAHAELVLLDNEITYSINFDRIAAKDKKDCLACLQAGMNEWEQDLDGGLKFTQVGAKDHADVIIHFRPAVTMNKEQVAGYVNWSRVLSAQPDGSVKPVFNADLQLRVKDLDGARMPMDAMRHAAMHELGHVLGLDDSPREGDVMGPLDVQNPVAAPTILEVQTVKSLRAEANEILQKAPINATR